MPEPFDAYQYLLHLKSRWRLMAVACGIAVGLAVVHGLLAQKQYVATARILIEPPGSSDPRAATSVSPVYLESLQTYEHLASSDSLFERAVNKLGIRDESRPSPLSSLKSAILETRIPRNTKILEISVTLPDPKKAQQLASFIAHETIRLNQHAITESDNAQAAPIKTLRAQAQERVREAEAASMEFAKAGSTHGLLEEVQALVDTRSYLQQQVFYAEDLRAELAREGRESAASPQAGETSRDSIAAAEERLERLHRQISELDGEIARKRRALASMQTRQQARDSEREAAWTALQQTEARLAQAQGTVAARGERLQVIDPGVVPERHSSPKRTLNVIVVFLLGLIGSLLYATLEFSLLLRQAESRRQSIRLAGHG